MANIFPREIAVKNCVTINFYIPVKANNLQS